MVLEATDLHGIAWLVFSRNWLWLAGVGCAGLVTMPGMPPARTLIRPLKGAVTFTTRLTAGDLITMVEVRSSDGLGEVMRAMDTIRASLSSIVHDIQGGAASVAHSTLQISVGNHDPSARTEQQAVVLEETASSTKELTSVITQDTNYVYAIGALTEQASTTAADDSQIVQCIAQTMDAIRANSQRVTEIIAAIENITFQTNILALNAAVETARMGEEGRGFIAVAGEVCSLVQRSARAATQSKEIIRASDQSARNGVDLIHKAGVAIAQIVWLMQTVTQLMLEVSTSSREQNSGIVQTNVSVSQPDEVTQQNTTLVEEAAAATSVLTRQSGDLEHTVAVFRA